MHELIGRGTSMQSDLRSLVIFGISVLSSFGTGCSVTTARATEDNTAAGASSAKATPPPTVYVITGVVGEGDDGNTYAFAPPGGTFPKKYVKEHDLSGLERGDLLRFVPDELEERAPVLESMQYPWAVLTANTLDGDIHFTVTRALDDGEHSARDVQWLNSVANGPFELKVEQANLEIEKQSFSFSPDLVAQLAFEDGNLTRFEAAVTGDLTAEFKANVSVSGAVLLEEKQEFLAGTLSGVIPVGALPVPVTATVSVGVGIILQGTADGTFELSASFEQSLSAGLAWNASSDPSGGTWEKSGSAEPTMVSTVTKTSGTGSLQAGVFLFFRIEIKLWHVFGPYIEIRLSRLKEFQTGTLSSEGLFRAGLELSAPRWLVGFIPVLDNWTVGKKVDSRWDLN
jgi:hypothetical protein